jgi:hypothetical protein
LVVVNMPRVPHIHAILVHQRHQLTLNTSY